MTAAGPPAWKQALTVLLALYPTVMALSYVNPLMSNFSLPLQMLSGNILSIALLTWLVMPWVTQGFWVLAQSKEKELALGSAWHECSGNKYSEIRGFFRILASVQR